MKNPWVALVAVGAAVAGAAITGAALRRPAAPAVEPPPAAVAPAEESPAPVGKIELKAEQVEHVGVKTETIAAGTLSPEVQLFGTLQEDPAASFTVRSEFSGIVQQAKDYPWPALGQMIPDDTVIGALMPRAAPADVIALSAQRVTLQTQVAAAQADMNTATTALEAARAAYERAKALNAQDKNIADRVVEEALARVKSEEAHLQGAKQTLELATQALNTKTTFSEAMPLKVVHGGEVVEIPARPGEAVESGQPVLRVVRFDRIVAAVEVPPDITVGRDVKEARILPLAAGGRELKAERLGSAATTDLKTKSQILLFRVGLGDDKTSTSQVLRPGAPVIAIVSLGGEPLKGVTIPSSAVVRYLGKAWVYVVAPADGAGASPGAAAETKPADKSITYNRQEIALGHPMPDGKGWFVIEGFKAGQEVVTTGAAMLLSAEVNAKFGGEAP